jgi:carbonic anhydrase/acetyltransferase-like protein (isoleucine patch superfamily)
MSFRILPFKNIYPQVDETAYIADNCALIGDVKVGKNSNIWFNSVLRGDVDFINVGDNTNIQDGSVIHTSRFNGPTNIGNNITIGHMALIHACTIKDFAFIGMNSTIMDYVIVEEYGFVAAGAVLTPGKIVKSMELWAGVPAKFVRKITDDEITEMKANTNYYVELAAEYKLL